MAASTGQQRIARRVCLVLVERIHSPFQLIIIIRSQFYLECLNSSSIQFLIKRFKVKNFRLSLGIVSEFALFNHFFGFLDLVFFICVALRSVYGACSSAISLSASILLATLAANAVSYISLIIVFEEIMPWVNSRYEIVCPLK